MRMVWESCWRRTGGTATSAGEAMSEAARRRTCEHVCKWGREEARITRMRGKGRMVPRMWPGAGSYKRQGGEQVEREMSYLQGRRLSRFMSCGFHFLVKIDELISSGWRSRSYAFGFLRRMNLFGKWERKLTRKATLKIVGKFSDISMLILLLFIVANVHTA